jgi:hypothetical protein
MIDYGASFHMTSHREWFRKYEECNGGKVLLASDSSLEILVVEESESNSLKVE